MQLEPFAQETETVVVVGIGELGAVFARGFLKTGFTVVPVNRNTAMSQVARGAPEPALVLIAVGEAVLPSVLTEVPEIWRDRLLLIQNELLPPSWASYDLVDPTVASVWFEKKAGQDSKVIIPTPVTGPASTIVVEALASIGIPAREVDSEAMVTELVAKNLYILTSNIAGLDLPVGTTVGDLWSHHREHAESVVDDVLSLQEALVGHQLDRPELVGSMEAAFAGDPDHKAMGRSAPARLERALLQASELGIDVPNLLAISDRQG